MKSLPQCKSFYEVSAGPHSYDEQCEFPQGHDGPCTHTVNYGSTRIKEAWANAEAKLAAKGGV